MNLSQIRDQVIVPALTQIGYNDPAAVRLVLGTGLIESNYEALAQYGGPALGFWQMEPATANDLWTNYIMPRAHFLPKVYDLMIYRYDKVEQLTWNLRYAAAMCRIKYLSIPASLPDADDLEGIAAYYKQWYNTPLGAATASRFIDLANENGLMSL